MKYKSLILIIFFPILFFCCRVRAQDSSIFIPCLFTGSLLYDFPKSYGFSISADKPLLYLKNARRSINRPAKGKEKVLFLSAELGAYRYPLNYTGVFFTPTIGIRHYYSHFFSDLSFKMGLLRTFYDGVVYIVSSGGVVKNLKFYGRSYAVSGLSYCWNWQLQRSTWKGIYLQVKPTLWFQFPYDNFIKGHASLQAGISYVFHSAWIK